jgi:hypothetical protein
MFTCSLPPAAYDVVLLANICHLFDEDRNRALLHRLRPTVRPGGLLAIIDVLTQADLAAQRWISLYAFFLRLRTSQRRRLSARGVRNLGQRRGIRSCAGGAAFGRTVNVPAGLSDGAAVADGAAICREIEVARIGSALLCGVTRADGSRVCPADQRCMLESLVAALTRMRETAKGRT